MSDPVVEVLVRTHRAKRPSGAEVLIHEYWEMVDTGPAGSGTNYLPGMKRLALPTGEIVRELDQGFFQLAATGEILRAVGIAPTGNSTSQGEP